MYKKALPFTKLDPLLILTVGGRELNVWINNELEKKEYAINSAGEKSTHPRVKHMPRPQSQQGDASVEVAGQSSWGAAGQTNHWLGRHFHSSAGNQRQKQGGGGRMRHITEPLQIVSLGKSQDQANWSVSTQTRWKTFTSPMKHVSKFATDLTQKGTKLLPISHCSKFYFKLLFSLTKKKKKKNISVFSIRKYIATATSTIILHSKNVSWSSHLKWAELCMSRHQLPANV